MDETLWLLGARTDLREGRRLALAVDTATDEALSEGQGEGEGLAGGDWQVYV